MDKYDRVLVIRCFDTCTYTIEYPRFFLEADKATLRKILKYLFRFEWLAENQNTICFLNQALPDFVNLIDAKNAERIAAAEKEWYREQACYQVDFRDPNPATFPVSWDEGHKKAEKAQRKAWNAKLKERMKNAKSRYEQAKRQALKDYQRAQEIGALYLTAKGEL